MTFSVISIFSSTDSWHSCQSWKQLCNPEQALKENMWNYTQIQPKLRTALHHHNTLSTGLASRPWWILPHCTQCSQVNLQFHLDPDQDELVTTTCYSFNITVLCSGVDISWRMTFLFMKSMARGHIFANCHFWSEMGELNTLGGECCLQCIHVWSNQGQFIVESTGLKQLSYTCLMGILFMRLSRLCIISICRWSYMDTLKICTRFESFEFLSTFLPHISHHYCFWLVHQRI